MIFLNAAAAMSRLQELTTSIDAMPSANLYIMVLIASIAFSFVLINTGNHSLESAGGGIGPSAVAKSAAKKSAKKPRSPNEPQPKWHILKLLNYAAVFAFTISVGEFVSDASTYLNDSSALLKFLIGWSACLCYFFGFFGISFVDADEIIAEAESEGGSAPALKTVSCEGAFSHHNGVNGVTILSKKEVPAPILRKKSQPLHVPASSTPVCGTKSKPSLPRISREEAASLTDEQASELVLHGQVKDHQLEKLFGAERAVTIRRHVFCVKFGSLGRSEALKELPHVPPGHCADWYERIHGANCEIVSGYIPIPVGIVGPLTLNGETVYVPMATTEGCLVASTNRGCKAISSGGMGAVSTLLRDGITRAPCLQFSSARNAALAKLWIEEPENFAKLKNAFETTTSFGRLESANPTVAGRNVYLRLKCFSGDAMGMNMVSKGSLAVVDLLKTVFEDMSLIALSGNMCTDKKAAATNWIEGRGKSVVVETVVPKSVVQSTLKTTVGAMVSVNNNKNLIGSAMAGAVGGFNAHASNIVTAIFLATGQDPAQNVESSNCITLMEETADGDLWMSCTMPSIEVGTVGGGTSLPAQGACLDVIGVRGGGKKGRAGENAQKLAHVVAAATMAGELSLLAALAANTLVSAHMQHNRKVAGPTASTRK